ncbi:MAG: hypothetical protein H6862_02545 [Rhodospirillales bacterium]|nr:hypothetical protein [Rhodospirillales bacterium]
MTEGMFAFEIVHAIAEVVQRHGQHDFPSDETGTFTRIATLCGLTVYFDGRAIKRIKAHDMDLHCETSPSVIGQTARLRSRSPLSFRFLSGSANHLDKWYKQLLQFDRFFEPARPVMSMPVARPDSFAQAA